MSLINDMLRDLEARHSDELKRQNLQGEIRPLPSVAAKPWRIWIALFAVLLLLMVAGIYAWLTASPSTTPVVAIPVKPAPIPQPVALPATPPGMGPPPAISAALAVSPPAMPENKGVSAAASGISSVQVAQPTMQSVTTTSLPKAVKAERPVPAIAPITETSPAKSVAAAPVSPEKPSLKAAKAVEDGKAVPAPAAKEKPAASGTIEVKAILATARERADADYRSAQGLLASGRQNEAVEALKSALKHDSEYGPARQLLIRQLIDQKRFEEAMAALSEGLELQPRQTAWAMTLARLQVEKNDLSGAERTLARYSAHAAGQADYAGFHAHIQYRLGHHREAVLLYQTATKMAATEGRWWFGLGVALEAEGKMAEAREAFRQALATGTLNNELSAQAMQRLR